MFAHCLCVCTQYIQEMAVYPDFFFMRVQRNCKSTSSPVGKLRLNISLQLIPQPLLALKYSSTKHSWLLIFDMMQEKSTNARL